MNTCWVGFRVGARVAVTFAVVCGFGPATAGDFDYRASLGAGYSDNVNRVSENEVDTNFATAGLRFSFDELTAKLRADVVGDLAYYDYMNDAFKSELIGNVYADSSFALIPDRILWSASDQFGQLPIDPFLPATPDNRENINYFSTGPDFMVGLGSQMRLRLGARYSVIDYETDPLDSTVTGGQLALIRAISGRSSISLNASVQKFEYKVAALNADFDQTEMYLRYTGEGARTNLKIDAGYSQLDRDALDTNESGALLRLDASRRISASSILSLIGGRQFSTAAGSFASDQGSASLGLGAAPGRQNADPFTLDQLALTWDFERSLTGLALTTSWAKRSYDGNPVLDQSTTTITARLRRDLSASTSLQFSASQTGVRYNPPAVDYDESTAGLSFSWVLSRNLTFDARYNLSHRSSDVASGGYTENRLWLTIGYGRGMPRATRVAPTFGVDSMTSPGQ
jgi:hypothetical protein